MLLMFVLLVVLVAVAGYRLSSYGKQIIHTTADEVHMVTTSDLWHIRLCRYLPKGGSGEPVFLVHGFMGNHLNFSLPTGESLVDVLTEAGYDCWLIELRGSVSSVPPFGHSRKEATIEDYLYEDISAALEFIQKKTNHRKVHWIGHSLGGMLLYAYQAAFGGDTIASGTTIGSPIRFEGVRLRGVKAMTLMQYLPASIIRGLQRLGVLVAHKFNLNIRLVPVNWQNMNPVLDPRTLSNVVEAPPIPVAKELAFCVANKVWRINNDEIDVSEAMKDFNIPLFAIFGAGDTFVPLHTIEDFFDSLPVKDKDLMILSQENDNAADYSHIDLIFGQYSADEVFQPIVGWLQDHPLGERGKEDTVKMRARRTPQPVAVETEQSAQEPGETPKPKTKTARKPAPKKKSAATLRQAEAAAKEPPKPKVKKPAVKKKPADGGQPPPAVGRD